MGLDSSYISLTIGLISLALFILLRSRGQLKLNEPPLVPYKYPIIGHTFDYYKDTVNFIKKCQAEYGETFSLYVFGRVITFVGRELSPEVLRNYKDFDFNEANQEFFPLSDFMHRQHEFFLVVTKVIQANLSGEIKLYTERVQRQLIKSIDEIFGGGKVVEPPLKFFQFIVAKPIAATFAGEELSDDQEFVNSFAYIVSDMAQFLSIPPILNFIHPSLHKKLMIILFKYLNNPFKVHVKLIRKKIVPVIEKRLIEMKTLGNAYVPPTDLLQRFIEVSLQGYTINFDDVIDRVVVTVFASVHTTSTFLTFCLHEWTNNPQCHKELLEEQVQIYNNNENSYYSIEQIAKMEKLDSFIKETMRTCTHVTLDHKTLSPYFTFSNGDQVPKDRIVSIRVEEIHSDEELQGRNPNEFNAFRHLKKNSATHVERNYLTFGFGKHACPGRYFAVNEIKVALHYLLLKYDIRKDNNEKIRPNLFGPYKFPSNEGLVFEKKSVN